MIPKTEAADELNYQRIEEVCICQRDPTRLLLYNYCSRCGRPSELMKPISLEYNPSEFIYMITANIKYDELASIKTEQELTSFLFKLAGQMREVVKKKTGIK